MENFPEEKEIEQQIIEKSNVPDIQFEEVMDIDEIQKKLQEKIYENDEIPDLTDQFELIEIKQRLPIENNEDKQDNKHPSVDSLNPKIEIDRDSKKYVIYIDSNNVDFMENLSVDDRRLIINKALKEQYAISARTKELKARKRFLTHLIVACLTFIIGFPILFIAVNKAMETSIVNYREAKENITKLYKQSGKIKMHSNDAAENIKY